MTIKTIHDLRTQLANCSLLTYGKSVEDLPYDQWCRMVEYLRECYLFAHACKKRQSSDHHQAITAKPYAQRALEQQGFSESTPLPYGTVTSGSSRPPINPAERDSGSFVEAPRRSSSTTFRAVSEVPTKRTITTTTQADEREPFVPGEGEDD